MSSYRIEVPQLESVTRAIGYICVFWGWLEGAVDALLITLLPLEKITVTPEEVKRIADAIVASLDMRDKIRILRAVAFVRKIDAKWFKRLMAVLDLVDNDLRMKRNRYVHDVWSAPRGRLRYTTRQTKFKKPQAFVLELVTEEHTHVKMKDVWGLGDKIVRAMIKLTRLEIEYRELDEVIKTELKKKTGEAQVDAILKQITARFVLLPLTAKPPEQRSRPAASEISRPNSEGSRRRPQR
jgi:hypothetical protein